MSVRSQHMSVSACHLALALLAMQSFANIGAKQVCAESIYARQGLSHVVPLQTGSENSTQQAEECRFECLPLLLGMSKI